MNFKAEAESKYRDVVDSLQAWLKASYEFNIAPTELRKRKEQIAKQYWENCYKAFESYIIDNRDALKDIQL